MARILYLVHRIPYPPNKGDKLRSFHFLQHLAKKNEVFLGTFADTLEDMAYLPKLSEYCTGINVLPLSPHIAKLRSLNGILAGDPLTIRYFRDAAMQHWVNQTIKIQKIDAAIIFCSGMAQYVEHCQRLPVFVDLVDVDSDKWRVYASKRDWPMRWIYDREARTLLAYERKIAARSVRTFLVTDEERSLFATLAPESTIRLEVMPNGVDTDYFDPNQEFPNPYPDDVLPIVFTGTMDYWINIEGGIWFIQNVLPRLLNAYPNLKLYVVGRNPTPELTKLASDHVVVTGAVDDVRPYIRHAKASIAPIKTSRGVQNKVLESMAMARPTIADASCSDAIKQCGAQELIIASSIDDYLGAIEKCLEDTEFSDVLGKNARARILADYNWTKNFSCIDPYLEKPGISGP